jgi:hypothetical protein
LSVKVAANVEAFSILGEHLAQTKALLSQTP